MKREDINIRDPYVLVDDGKYYLYGTRSETCWGEAFGLDGDCYFSDGPFFMKLDDGNLYMIFSSWSINGYAVGIAVSESGTINGPWILQDEPLYPENGGHGMFFKDLQGNLVFTLHSPNDKYMERPQFLKVKNKDGILYL